MGAQHDHSQSPNPGLAFGIGIALNLSFVVVEAVFGFLANSMALFADAGHNLADVLGLAVAWAGAILARSAPTRTFTYGLKKASILSALVNALFLLVAIGAIVAEAVRRLLHPAPTAGGIVVLVAAVGIAVNGITAILFARGSRRDINVRGAFLHMAADAGVSAAVVAAGLFILWTGMQWIDPAMSLAVAVVILGTSLGLLKESVRMSLAGVPSAIDVEAVENALASLDGVAGVHHVHIWALSTTETALTAHLVAPVGHAGDLISRARHMLGDRFHIGHCTLQLERQDERDLFCYEEAGAP